MFEKLTRRNANIERLLQKHSKDAILPTDLFLPRLRQERLRMERSHAAVGLVAINCSGLLETVREKMGAVEPALACLASALDKSTRESDITGWYNPGALLIIAPDTNETGVCVMAERLVNNLASSLSSTNGMGAATIRPFFCVSSLVDDCEALVKSWKVDADPARKGPSKKSDRIDGLLFSRPGIADFHFVGQNQGCPVAVATWPLFLEKTSSARGKEISLKIKRVLDIVGALTGIVLFLPLMIAIGILVKLTSPGPILFRQKRLGHLGRPFTFIKFRSMKVEADPTVHEAYVKKLIRGENAEINQGSEDKPVFKMTDDPRITFIGMILRKTSLDELPQFLNVLKGEMSLVGPRPPIPYECDEYKLWHYRRVLDVKPGITGLWQVCGRSSLTFDEMVRLDLTYARTWNLWLDIKILCRTITAVFGAKGAF